MKKVRIAMLLYVAVGLIPLAALSRLSVIQAKQELASEESAQLRSEMNTAQNLTESADAEFERLLTREFSREFTEYQHWRAPLNIQARGPSVVRSSLAGKPLDPLIKFYFQVSCDGSTFRFNTPHLPDDQAEPLESYQSAAPLPDEFIKIVHASRDSILKELPYLVSAMPDSATTLKPTDDANLVAEFLSLRSARQPASAQVVSNDVLIVNSNSQEVANKARNEQIQKKQSRSGKEEDPWSGLKRPPGLDDAYGDSIVQIYPFCSYRRMDDQRRMIFWRTVKTPSEQIMQGFELDLDYIQTTWLGLRFGTRARPGPMFEPNPPGLRFNASLQEGGWSRADFSRQAGVVSLGLGGPRALYPNMTAAEDRLSRIRANYLWVGTAYSVLIAVLGIFLYRTVSRSESLAQQQGEFVAAVSHELRTPLTAMRLFTELLIGQAKATNNEKVEQHASRILAEEERLTRLVEMILLSARIERGSFKLELVLAPLSDPLHAAVEMAQRAHAGREIVVEIKDLPSVRLDRAAAQQVFFNLIDNALKYSRENNKPVRISSETQAGAIQLRIADEGVGIADNDMASLFQRFYRGQKASEHGAGTGLGLWLTQEYARQMGWTVTLKSKPGAGTQATVTIPHGEK